jgi:hypothetical protein
MSKLLPPTPKPPRLSRVEEKRKSIILQLRLAQLNLLLLMILKSNMKEKKTRGGREYF